MTIPRRTAESSSPSGEERARPSPEEQFAEQVRAFEAHLARFQQHERKVAKRERKVAEREEALAQQNTERRPAREALRDHAELSTDRLLAVLDEALAATQPNGAPDHTVRLAGVRVLLGEAYAAEGDAEATSAAMDELAAVRDRRAGEPGAGATRP